MEQIQTKIPDPDKKQEWRASAKKKKSIHKNWHCLPKRPVSFYGNIFQIENLFSREAAQQIWVTRSSRSRANLVSIAWIVHISISFVLVSHIFWRVTITSTFNLKYTSLHNILQKWRNVNWESRKISAHNAWKQLAVNAWLFSLCMLSVFLKRTWILIFRILSDILSAGLSQSIILHPYSKENWN